MRCFKIACRGKLEIKRKYQNIWHRSVISHAPQVFFSDYLFPASFVSLLFSRKKCFLWISSQNCCQWRFLLQEGLGPEFSLLRIAEKSIQILCVSVSVSEVSYSLSLLLFHTSEQGTVGFWFTSLWKEIPLVAMIRTHDLTSGLKKYLN